MVLSRVHWDSRLYRRNLCTSRGLGMQSEFRPASQAGSGKQRPSQPAPAERAEGAGLTKGRGGTRNSGNNLGCTDLTLVPIHSFGDVVKYVQTTALLEVVHVVLGLV